jgi:hypothetical protein
LPYLNPSFRVFEIDPDTKFPVDYLQYRMNLDEANKSDDPPKWEAKYRATEYFGLENLTEIEKIRNFVLKIESDEEINEKVLEAFFSGGPEYLARKKNKEMPKYFRCRFLENTFNDFFDCIGWHTWNHEEYSFKALNILTGKWYLRLPD